jgi:hypothetical protein
MMIQLSPPIPVLTPKGKGLAHILIDYGPEHHLIWMVFIDEGGQCWSFANPDVRAQTNPTMGRKSIELPKDFVNETLKEVG